MRLVARGDEIEPLQAQLGQGKCVLLVGDVGVGKSHFARTVTDLAEDGGAYVLRVFGSAAMQTVHLGAAQSLLPASAARNPDELFANIESDMRRSAGGRPVVILVDDIDQVDPATAALLQHLAATDVAILATVRATKASDPLVLQLWKGDLFERHDVGPFGPADSGRFVQLVLDGEVDPDVTREVFALASGNALFTRELLTDARQSGSLVEVDGQWTLTGELHPDRRVRDLFAARLRTLEPRQRDALDTIALGEPLPLAVARQLTTAADLELLETETFISVAEQQVRTAHPLLGEVARREIATLRAERLTNLLIDGLLASPSSSPSDVLRAVQWQLDRDIVPHPATAATAAQEALARFDAPTALRCAQAAFHPDSPIACALLGRAQLIAQQPDDAIATMRRGYQAATNDTERALTATGLGEALVFGKGDLTGANAALRQALATVTEAPSRAMLAGTLSVTRALVGDFQPALTYGEELLDSDEIDDLARLNLLVIWTVAASLCGDTKATQARIDTGIALAREHRDTMPAALDQLLVTQFMFDSADGRLTEALAFAAEQHEAAHRESRLTSIWDFCLATGSVMAGKGAAGAAHSAVAVASMARHDPIGVGSLSFAAQALALATIGDLAGAMDSHDRSLADPRCSTREQAFLARARAAVLVVDGELDGAITALTTGAAQSGDSFVWAGWALYDGVRFGRPEDVAAELLAIAGHTPAESILAMNDHCEALMACDASQLAKAAERLARAGFFLFAAEAAAHGSAQLRTDGDPTGAALAAMRALTFFGQCDSVRSMAIESLERPLTDREHEVAKAAGSGLASQEIADNLFVSRRTVDNHLQNAYRKLGINQRDELAVVFRLDR